MDETDPVGDYARDGFGVRYLYPYQRLVVANVLDAIDAEPDPGGPENQVVILPTGAGKSLCFQLPAALCPGPTLVVYPLLGLMADQERRLSASSVGAVVLKGGMTADERGKAIEAARSGTARVIISNPEALAIPGVAKALGEARVFHFVIDEAHCVAEWGDSFRPAYTRLGEAIRAVAPRVVTAFTATASPPILARVTELLFGARPYRLVSGVPDRPNIRYEVRPALSMLRALRQAVASMAKPMIVFAASRPGVEILAEGLRAAFPTLDARFYHAGLDKAERAALESWFMASADGVMCSTCAYGMGMDKPNIRSVVHFGYPASVEAYLQESGRAGRDGEPSDAVLIRKADPRDYGLGDGRATPVAAAATLDRIARARAEAMREYATGAYGCRRSYLLRTLGSDAADATACSSCDVCDGAAARAAPGSEEIAALSRRHPRRFDARGAAAFLMGAAYEGAAPLSGALGAWNQDEAEEALRAAATIGLVRTRARAPWKGRLTSARLPVSRA